MHIAASLYIYIYIRTLEGAGLEYGKMSIGHDYCTDENINS